MAAAEDRAPDPRSPIGPRVTRYKKVAIRGFGCAVELDRDFEAFRRELRLDPQTLLDVARLSSGDLARAANLAYDVVEDAMTQRRLPRHARGEYALGRLVEVLAKEERRRERHRLLAARPTSRGSAMRTPVRAFKCGRARRALRALADEGQADLPDEDQRARAALLSLEFPLRIAFVLSEVLDDRRDVAAVLDRPLAVVSADIQRAEARFEAHLQAHEPRLHATGGQS